MSRYAIYFIPQPDSALYRFGSSVLGYDCSTGAEIPLPSHPYFQPEAARDVSAEPRRYGFHATLKAPFSLTSGQSEASLFRHAESVFSDVAPVRLGRLEVAELGSFVALRPMENESVNELAGHCVTAFEPFRAPISDADRQRRLAAPLTERQIAHLDRWGYPYVFEDFRFHMTLTGSLSERDRHVALAALRELYAAIDQPVLVESVCIARQKERSARFVVAGRFPLGGRAPAM